MGTQPSFFEPHAHLEAGQQHAQSRDDGDRAEGHGPAQPHGGVTHIQRVPRVAVETVDHQVVGREEVVGIDLQHQPIEVPPGPDVACSCPQDEGRACDEGNQPDQVERTRSMSLPAVVSAEERQGDRHGHIDRAVDHHDSGGYDRRGETKATHGHFGFAAPRRDAYMASSGDPTRCRVPSRSTKANSRRPYSVSRGSPIRPSTPAAVHSACTASASET